MTQKVKECVYPESKNCRGCSHSFNPSLYDGGCMLHYRTGGGENLQREPERRTPGSFTHKKRIIKRGINPQTERSY